MEFLPITGLHAGILWRAKNAAVEAANPIYAMTAGTLGSSKKLPANPTLTASSAERIYLPFVRTNP
jgi:hypothetical protein